MQNMDFKILFIFFCVIHHSIYCQGRPVSKRTVSEVQLMHNLRHHQQVQERREWLQTRIQDIHNAAGRASSGDTEGWRRRLHPDELTELTPEEIQQALDFLEKLLKSKQ
ncbi:parathyroid hormone-like [Girardinichthys multiradiatus]|uniref:parathyroid hormone-like n=1 Tax=Girardinichthys multiradiatus TaxID=208333 RepID=UPI001FADF0A4|nr:parathyroid hormone-like [Girardinichthys multiradiatus]